MFQTRRYLSHLLSLYRTRDKGSNVSQFLLPLPKPISSWSCNPPSQKTSCKTCLTPFPPPASSSSSSSITTRTKWSCKACAVLNPYKISNCELCGTRAPALSLSNFEDSIDFNADSSIGSLFFPLQPCRKRKIDDPVPVSNNIGFAKLSALRGIKASKKMVSEMGDTDSLTRLRSFKILSYNVWFRRLEMHERMEALGDLIHLHSPDVICFQEVTPNIYDIFKLSNWWKVYRCSVSKEAAYSRAYFCMQLSKLPVKSFSCKPFGNSIMGRELCVAELKVQKNIPLTVATSHLESPCPAPPMWNQMYSKERVDQAKEALNFLKLTPNVIFGGDMNWDDKSDGQFPISDGWIDAWEELKPGENGWTYDTKSNKMFSGNRTLQKRLDRFVCKLQDFKVSSIEMIGTNSIPGLLYTKEKKVGKDMKKLELPVLPSDHYGLLLTITSL